ncbi:MAG: S9 family peptidase [Gemmatimonadales bacterium]
MTHPIGAVKLTVIALALAGSLNAQDQAAYQRADRIRTFDPQLVGGRIEPVFLTDSVRFYYEARDNGPDRGTLYLVDPRRRSRKPLFDNTKLATMLSSLSDTTVSAQRPPTRKMVDADQAMQFELRGRVIRCLLTTQQCALADSTQLAAARRATAPAWASRSPDGAWDAFIWNHNVYVRPAALAANEPPLPPRPGNPPRLGCDAQLTPGASWIADSLGIPNGSVALTSNGEPHFGYGTYKFGIGVAQLAADRYRPQPGGISWSPDSRRLTVRRDDLRGLRIFPLYSTGNIVPIDHSYFYAVPGDSVIPRADTYLIDVASRRSVRVQDEPIALLQGYTSIKLGRNPDELFKLSSTRGHKSVRAVVVGLETGATRTIAADSSTTSVELRSGGGETWELIDGGNELLWFSERDGWGHLYRYRRDGSLINQVESGRYSVGEISRVDDARRQIYFTAYGRAEGNPYYAHLFRVGFDGGPVTQLTAEPGNHLIRAVPKAPFFIDTYSTIESPPVTVLRAADGTVVMELARGDTRELATTGWTPAQVVTVKARDNETDLWGIMHRPSNFDSTRRYPIVVRIYPGPQIGSVGEWVFKGPDSRDGTRIGAFQYGRVWSGDGMGRSLAELGFIVIQIDAMGSPRRSKAFHDFYYGKMADNGLPDHMAAVRQLATRHPSIDTTRVGVWGHSGGGFSAAAAMFQFPEFFKVGVSQSGDHDVRSYGWYWGEKYQGPYLRTPTGDNYESEANYRLAHQLRGKLMLMHGEMDCNVHPITTLRVVDALIKADRDFDMLYVPDAGHQLPAFAIRQAWNYYVRHLAGREPPEYRMMPAPVER